MVRDLGLGFGSQISAMVVFEGKVSGVAVVRGEGGECPKFCLLYTSPSPRD